MAHRDDMVYLIICVVIFVFAVFGTMIFDKKQKTEQKVQRIRKIMRSLVIQTVQKDGQPGEAKRKSQSSRSGGKKEKELDARSTCDSSTEDEEEEQPPVDLENPIVGDIKQEQGITKGKKKSTPTMARWKHLTCKVASNHRNKPSTTANTTHSNGTLENAGESAIMDDDNDDVCPICIMPFAVGEQICWSKNPECDHAFHTECLKPWLMDHSECPCCRKDYLHWGESKNRKRRDKEKTTLRNVEHALSI